MLLKTKFDPGGSKTKVAELALDEETGLPRTRKRCFCLHL